MNRPVRVHGHADPTLGAPHDKTGQPIGTARTGFGYAHCTCGALSVEILPSQADRRRWHRMHREIQAGVPWL